MEATFICQIDVKVKNGETLDDAYKKLAQRLRETELDVWICQGTLWSDYDEELDRKDF